MAPKKNYTPEQMSQALEAVRRGEPVASAAKKYGVPRITLRNKFTGKSPAVCSMGPSTVLTETEENLLKQWIFAMSERHCPIGKDQLLDSVQKIVTLDKRTTPFTGNRPGKKWFNAFLARHPDLAVRVAQNLTQTRDNITEQQVRMWFCNIGNYFEEHNLGNVVKDPRRIFNADESAFFLNPKGGRVLVRRGDKNVYTTSGNEKENLTVLVTANAAGQLAPPMVVFTYERVPGHIANSVPENWGIGRSESGWMCGSTFFEFMTNVFYPWLTKSGIELPIIFFLDGHASHLTLHLAEFCASHQIELIALYPNSTHLLQPMDVAVFRPLKVFYKKNVNKWKSEHLGQEVKKENLGAILAASLEEISQECIKNGFRAGGLYPFGPDYVDFSKLNKKNRNDNSLGPYNSGQSLEDKQFLNKLEAEIVTTYSVQKLDLYKQWFYTNRAHLENQMPPEDISLYMIWAKYKHKCHIVGGNADTDDSLIPNPVVSSSSVSVSEMTVQNDNVQVGHKNEDTSSSQIPIQTANSVTPVKNNPSTSFADYILDKSNVIVPSPFKKALFWPEPDKKKRRSTKEKVPSVITSKAWREYNEKKILAKKEIEDQKEKRRLEREEKKRLKEQNIQNKKEQKKKGCKQIARKIRKESISSETTEDSDITYIDTGESELELQSDEEHNLEIETDLLLENKTKKEDKTQNVITGQKLQCVNPDLILTKTLNEEAQAHSKNEEDYGVRMKLGNPKIESGNKENRSTNIQILDHVPVNVVLDDKTGNFKVMALKSDTYLPKKPENPLSPTENPHSGKFVLVKFQSEQAKLFRYVCLVKEEMSDRILVQGYKSKKNKRTYKCVDDDVSIINKNEIMEYLPNPVIRNGLVMFPDVVDVKEL